MDTLPGPLKPLAAYNQFLLYRLIWDAQKLKHNKIPVNPHTLATYEKGSDWQNNPAMMTDADSALAAAKLCGPDYGVGFLFTAADPFWFVDIDKAYDGTEWSTVARDICHQLGGCAVEVSQSNTGLHIFGTGDIPPHSNKNIAQGLEFYHWGRFVALTGTSATGSADFAASAPLASVIGRYFAPREFAEFEGWSSEPVAEYQGITDDDELIAKAMASKSAGSVFSDRATFSQLWTADAGALAKAYPDDGGREYDASSADAGLAQHLAFWTGNNCERIRNLMERSRLVRDKWEREDYLVRTIERAVSLQKGVYTGGAIRELPPVEAVQVAQPTRRTGYQLMDATVQIEYFNDCVYVQDMHRVFMPDGSLLKPEQFNAVMGGYVFALDDIADKTTRKAFEVLTESQAVRFVKAHATTFKPSMPRGAIIEQDGRRLVNTYVPVDIDKTPGDVAPFLGHLARVLPVEQDRNILLSYMAACVQHQGVKFQWAPLLQGTEGNGKTLFTRCVAAAVGRRYTHYPKAMDIDNKFNGWLMDKVFIGVEDIFVPDHRREVLETLKPMITGGDGLEIQLKGVDQITADVCANFMLNSNHKDAIRKTRNDRRFAVFFTAQQSAEDLARDGMGGDYFPNLYEWLRGGGYAAISYFLTTYDIPDALNPATHCHRAPDTSSTEEAIISGLGAIEQEILEAIEEGRPGFAGGWVSSVHLDLLLENKRASRAVPPNKRRDLMAALGYAWHTGLVDGRVNNPVLCDFGKKSRLYVTAAHPSLTIARPADISKAYQDAQINK